MKLKRFISQNKGLLIILLLGLTPLIWFRDGRLIAGGDFGIPLNSLGDLRIKLFTWYEQISLGQPNFSLVDIFPKLSFWAFFKFLGLSLINVERLWFIFVFLLPGLSMYYLASLVLKGKEFNPARVIAALFYMFNLYVTVVITPNFTASLAYGIMPLILGLFIKGLNKESSSLRYALFIGLASLLGVSAAGNPADYIVIWVPIILYFLYHLILTGRKRLVANLNFAAQVLICYFLFNLWWLLPFCFSLSYEPGGRALQEVFPWSPGGSSFLRVIRLLGSWAFYGGHKGIPYYPYVHYYFTPPLIIATYSLTIIAFSALLFKKNERRVLFFALLSIIALFLSQGKEGYLAPLFRFLHYHLPGFWTFRHPFAKFGALLVLALAILLGRASETISGFLKASPRLAIIKYRAFWVILTLLIFFVSWPLLTGDVIFPQRGELYSQRVEIPDYWFEAGEWMNKEKGDFKLLVLPQNTYYGMSYSWRYTGTDVTPHLIHKPLLEQHSGEGGFWRPPSNQLLNLTYDGLRQKRNPYLGKLLGVMNVKYLLQRNDLEWEGREIDSPQNVRLMLTSQRGIRFKKRFGYLDIYQNIYFTPQIYAATKIEIKKNLKKMVNEIARAEFTPGDSVFFLSERLSPEEERLVATAAISSFLAKRKPAVKFEKINPAKYFLRVTSQRPFFLVFSESYHPYWRIYAGRINWFKALFANSLSNKHLMAYGYANSWYINKTGEYNITLYFWPQSFFYLGLGILGLTFVGCVGYLVGTGIRSGKRRAKSTP